MKKGSASPRNAAMHLLARREHSREELKRKLRRRFSASELDAALDTLAEDKLQSDARFALSFTRERMLRGYGPIRIRAELRRRGVGTSEIDRAISTVPLEESLSWQALAEDVIRKRFGIAPPADLREEARRQRFLHYRGFGNDDG